MHLINVERIMEIEYGNWAVIIVAGKNHQWMLRLVYKDIMRKNRKFAYSHSISLKILIITNGK